MTLAATRTAHPPRISADLWAERARYIATGAERGPYRTERTPYVREPLRVASSGRYRKIAFVCGSQMGKTNGVLLNVMGHRLDTDAVPMIVGFPTRNTAESQFEPKFASMLRNCPSLWAKTAQGKEYWKKTHKKIAGCDVRTVWTTSSAEMASQEAGFAALDELDRMDDVPGEGDPVEVMEGRVATFADSLIMLMATPTLGTIDTYVDEHGYERWRVSRAEDVESRIWRAWQEGTRHEFMWPCPDCGLYFVPRFKTIWWPEGHPPLAQIRRDARVKCPHCARLLDDQDKIAATTAGVHVAPGQRAEAGRVEGDPPESETWSTWVSGICSPWRTIGSIAAAYVKAARSGDPGTLQGVKNLRLGELYSLAGQALPWQEVKQKLLAAYHMGEVPDGVQLLVAAVDVQADRFVYEVRGWGLRMRSWLIETGELYCDPTSPQGRSDLAALLDKRFGGFPIRLMLVDSGYIPATVYEFGRAHPDRVRITKGASTDLQGRRYKANVTDVSARRGTTLPAGMRLWSINTTLNKDFVWGRLNAKDEQSEGFWLPMDVPDRYVLELTGETRLTVAKGGSFYRKLRANHGLDTAVLTVVAAYMLGVDRMVDPLPPRPPQSYPPPPGTTVPAPRDAVAARPVRFRFGG